MRCKHQGIYLWYTFHVLWVVRRLKISLILQADQNSILSIQQLNQQHRYKMRLRRIRMKKLENHTLEFCLKGLKKLVDSIQNKHKKDILLLGYG